MRKSGLNRQISVNNHLAMERYLLIIILMVAILGVMLWSMPQTLADNVELSNAQNCYVFCRQTTLNCTNVGFGKIVQTSGINFFDALLQCDGVDGISFCFERGKFDVGKVLARLKVTVRSKQNLDGLTIICGYSPKIAHCIYVDGNKTNLQIAFGEQTVTIGSPLILGSY